MNRLHFEVARTLASGRVVWDLCRTVVQPVAAAPGPAPPPRIRPGTADLDSRRRLRLLTWNVHRGYRADGVLRSLERLVATEEPDLLLLQEVPVDPDGPLWERDGFRQLLATHHLAYAPMHHVRRQTSYYPFETTGQLTASRSPLDAVEVIALPTVSRPKLGPNHRVERVALYTEMTIAGGRVGVCNVHLENTTRPSGRTLQAREVVHRVGAQTAPTLVVGGDLNTVFGSLEEVPVVLEQAGFQEAPPEPRHWPHLDRVFVRGASGCGPARRLDASGSDHRPVAVEVVIGE